jgi:hypothetical protein
MSDIKQWSKQDYSSYIVNYDNRFSPLEVDRAICLGAMPQHDKGCQYIRCYTTPRLLTRARIAFDALKKERMTLQDYYYQQRWV